jgi:hypothetical protein
MLRRAVRCRCITGHRISNPDTRRGATGDSGAVQCYALRIVAIRKPAPSRMTLDEFLAWDPSDQTGCTWQLIDGEPVAMAPGSETHARCGAKSPACWAIICSSSECRIACLADLASCPGSAPIGTTVCPILV